MLTDLWPLFGLRLTTPRRLRLDRANWAAARHVPVKIVGLEPCLPMFGR